MKLAIMQPYFFPYIGYFQLLKAVDTFVIYDDVNFIKQGWINRNRFLLNNREHMFNIVLSGASSFKKINEIKVSHNHRKLIRTIEQAYKKAPYFNEIFPLIKLTLEHDQLNLAKFLINSILIVINYLNINVTILISSDIPKNESLKGEDKVIEICKLLGSSTYINAIGGIELYSKKKFKENEIDLYFLRPKPIFYQQFQNQFIPWLSIIDIIMFNSPHKINEMLNQYELV